MRFEQVIFAVGLVVLMSCSLSTAQDNGSSTCGFRNETCNATQCCGGLIFIRCLERKQEGTPCGGIFDLLHCRGADKCAEGLECTTRRRGARRCLRPNTTTTEETTDNSTEPPTTTTSSK